VIQNNIEEEVTMKIKIGVSARHIHLTKEDVEALFGIGYKLTKYKQLSQPNEYSCEETVTIKTNKGEIHNVRLLGPEREYTQIEISKTDAYLLGINPPVRNSGDIEGSESITLISDKNELYKPYGCIIATRHIHLNPADASKYNLSEGKEVSVRLLNEEKGGIIDHVYIKMDEVSELELHIDLDDANAHLVKNGDEGELIINE
jgi:putative phosphotransacetylase